MTSAIKHDDAPKSRGVLNARRFGRAELVFWLLVLCNSVAWPVTGLSALHFVFFIILCAAIYLSFIRGILPLMLYFTVMLFYWVLVPIFQERLGVGFYSTADGIPVFGVAALMFTSVHIIGTLLGACQKRIVFRRGQASRRVDGNAGFVGIMLAMLILALLVCAVGPSAFSLSRSEQAAQLNDGSYLLFLTFVAKFIPFVLVIYVWSMRGSHNRKICNVLIVFFIILALLMSNPTNTARFISLSGFLLIVMFYAVGSNRMRVVKSALIFFPVYAVGILASTSALRSGFQFTVTDSSQMLRGLEFSSYSIFVNALHVHNFPRHDFFLSHLFLIVPKAFWPDKAPSLGIYVASHAGYMFSNVGVNSFVEPFVDYGWSGLFVVSYIYGAVCNSLNPTRYSASFRNRPFVYGLLLTVLSPILFRGDLGTMMIGLYSASVAYEVIRFGSLLRMRF